MGRSWWGFVDVTHPTLFSLRCFNYEEKVTCLMCVEHPNFSVDFSQLYPNLSTRDGLFMETLEAGSWSDSCTSQVTGVSLSKGVT